MATIHLVEFSVVEFDVEFTRLGTLHLSREVSHAWSLCLEALEHRRRSGPSKRDMNLTNLAFLPTVCLYEPVKGRNLEGAPIEKRDTLEELIRQARELGGLEHQKLVVSEHIREIIRQPTTSRSEPELHNTLIHNLSTLNTQISTLQDQIEVTKASILTQ